MCYKILYFRKRMTVRLLLSA